MAFRSARENTDDTESGSSSAAWQTNSSDSDTGGGEGVGRQSTGVHEQYDAPRYSTDWQHQLMRREKEFGQGRVSQWADEGMPVEAMGQVRGMDEFRDRQAERSEEIPTDVEQQNEASLYRNKKAQHDTAATGDAGVPGSVRDVVSSPGKDLNSDVKSGLEDRLDTSLDHVQVHTGPKAQQACEEVNARAFAVGNHIAFGPGEYDPGSSDGQHLIAHEVVHTLQQPDAPMSMMPKTQVDMEIDPDPQAEREADNVADEVLKGDQVGIDGMWNTDVHVQRSIKGTVTSTVKGAMGLDDEDDLQEYIEATVEEKVSNVEDAAETGAARAQNAASHVAAGGRRGLNAVKNSRAAAVGSTLTQASTRGAIGSAAGAVAGKIAGRQGGAALGATLGATAGTLLGPLGLAVGAEAGRQLGAHAGEALVGGAASDTAKQMADYTMPDAASKHVKQLQAQFQELQDKVNQLERAQDVTGSGSSQGVGKSGNV